MEKDIDLYLYIKAWRNAIDDAERIGEPTHFMAVGANVLKKFIDELERMQLDSQLYVHGFPEPCIRADGKDLISCSTREWYEKLFGEALEAHEAADNQDRNHEGMELTDVITVCHSRLHALGFSKTDILRMQMCVNSRNMSRGRLRQG